jgi:hypothetical protein
LLARNLLLRLHETPLPLLLLLLVVVGDDQCSQQQQGIAV